MFLRNWLKNFKKSDDCSPDFDSDDMKNAFRAGFKAYANMTSSKEIKSDVKEKLENIANDVIAIHVFEKITKELLTSMEEEMEELAEDYVVKIQMYNPLKDNSLYIVFRGIESGMVDFVINY